MLGASVSGAGFGAGSPAGSSEREHLAAADALTKGRPVGFWEAAAEAPRKGDGGFWRGGKAGVAGSQRRRRASGRAGK